MILSIRNAGMQRRKIHNSKLSKELFSYSKLRNFDKRSALIRFVIQRGFFAFKGQVYFGKSNRDLLKYTDNL